MAIASVTILSACGASAPPAEELAIEMVDTLDVSDAVKDCMRDEIAGFEVGGDGQAFSSLDDAANSARAARDRRAKNPEAGFTEDEETAIDIMDDFEAALTGCT